MGKLSRSLIINGTEYNTKLLSANVSKGIGTISYAELILSNKDGGLKDTFSYCEPVTLQLGRDGTNETVFTGTVQRINRVLQGGNRLLLTCHGWGQDLDDQYDDPYGLRDASTSTNQPNKTTITALLPGGDFDDFSELSSWSVHNAGGSYSTTGDILTVSPTDGTYAIKKTVSVDTTVYPFLYAKITSNTLSGGSAKLVFKYYDGASEHDGGDISTGTTGLIFENVYEKTSGATVTELRIYAYGTSGSVKLDFVSMGGIGSSWCEGGGVGQHSFTKCNTRLSALRLLGLTFGGNLWVDDDREFQFKMPWVMQPPSCILYYPFEEGSGTDALDSSVWGNDGTHNCDYATGQIGSYCLDFNGASDEVDAGDIDFIDGANELSIACWVKWEGAAPAASHRICVKSGVASLINGSVDQTKVRFVVDAGGVKTSGESSTNVFDGNYHFIVGTFGQTNIKIYVDGQEESSGGGGGTLVSNANHVYIGGGGAEYWNGKIDEVMIFRKELQPWEIGELYHKTSTDLKDYSYRDGWTESTSGWTSDGGGFTRDNTQKIFGSWCLYWTTGAGATSTTYRALEDFTLKDYDFIDFCIRYSTSGPAVTLNVQLRNSGTGAQAEYGPIANWGWLVWRYFSLKLPETNNDHGWTFSGGGSASMTVNQVRFLITMSPGYSGSTHFDAFALTRVGGQPSVKTYEWGTDILNVSKLDDRLSMFSEAYQHYDSGSPYYKSATDEGAIADIGLRQYIGVDYQMSSDQAVTEALLMLSAHGTNFPQTSITVKGNTDVGLRECVTINAPDYDLSNKKMEVIGIAHSFNIQGWRTTYICSLRPLERTEIAKAYAEEDQIDYAFRRIWESERKRW